MKDHNGGATQVVNDPPNDGVAIGESPDGDRLGGNQARWLLANRRDVLKGLGAMAFVATVAEGSLSGSSDGGTLYGGTMALDKAYKIGPRTYMGPDSAKSNVLSSIDDDEGWKYEAVDTQVDYWLDDGSWQGPMGIGSDSVPVPETVTDDLATTNTPFVDVTQYGVVGDGSTDDATAFQSAVDAATPHGVLFIPWDARVRLGSSIDIDLGLTDSQVSNENPDDVNRFTFLCHGELQIDSGVDPGVHIHHGLGPQMFFRLADGGDSANPVANRGIRVSDMLGGYYEGVAYNYDGEVFTVDKGNSQSFHWSVGRLYTFDCGRSIRVKPGPAGGSGAGMGQFDDVWSKDPQKGALFEDTGDITIGHFENVMKRTESPVEFNGGDNLVINSMEIGGSSTTPSELLKFVDTERVNVGNVFLNEGPNGVLFDDCDDIDVTIRGANQSGHTAKFLNSENIQAVIHAHSVTNEAVVTDAAKFFDITAHVSQPDGNAVLIDGSRQGRFAAYIQGLNASTGKGVVVDDSAGTNLVTDLLEGYIEADDLDGEALQVTSNVLSGASKLLFAGHILDCAQGGGDAIDILSDALIDLRQMFSFNGTGSVANDLSVTADNQVRLHDCDIGRGAGISGTPQAENGVFQGSYTGDGTQNQAIDIRHSPRVIIIQDAGGTIYDWWDGIGKGVFGSSPAGELTGTNTGLEVGDNGVDADPNTDTESYTYWAA